MAQLNEIKFKSKNGAEVIVTSPKPGVGAELLVCMQQVIASSHHLLMTSEEFASYTSEHEEQMIQKFTEHSDKILIVPKVNGKIVGLLDFSAGGRKRNAHQGEFGMSLHPDYRGMGIGRAMLQALIDWGKANPRIITLRLKVSSENTNAVALYKSCGFVEEGRELEAIKLSDEDYDDLILMALHI